MTKRIVTTAYRYQRPPRKRAKAVAIEPAVVRAVGKKADLPHKAGEPTPISPSPPANDDRKITSRTNRPALVTTASRKQLKLGRQDDRPEDPEASSAMRAWLLRAMRGRGPAG